MQDSVAQLVEQYTFNVWVLGSNPSGITTKASFSRGLFSFTLQMWNKASYLSVKRAILTPAPHGSAHVLSPCVQIGGYL